MINCRICNNQINNYFLSLGNSPLSNSYINEKQLSSFEVYYPLNLYFCNKCRLVMIDEFEKAENIFSEDYAYYSSYSTSWLLHCKNYTDMITDRFNIGSNSLVIEIASNDGYLLQYFNDKGIKTLGIEPTAGTASIAISKGIETEVSFFDTTMSKKLVEQNKKADLLIGNNVLAHTPYINDFVAAMKETLNNDGVITMEFPHILNMIKYNQFDTIYHEHFSYLSLFTVNYLFEQHGLKIFDVDKINTHGGSIRIYAKHIEDNSKEKSISQNVHKLLEEELEYNLDNLDTYLDFTNKIYKIKRDLLAKLIELKNMNKIICCYGAPAKGNTLLNYCGIKTDFIEFTVDISPHKQNKFLPGSHIPITNIDEIKKLKPDYIFILPWNIKDEIINTLNKINDWGAKYMIAIPNLEILS